MSVQDNFPQLLKAIDMIADRGRAQNVLKGTATVITQHFMAELEKVQPDGSNTYVGERPSIRRGYVPIASGWMPVDIGETDKGISISQKSMSRHINWQRFGTQKKEYNIPSWPTGVYFWWGAPLPWTPSEIPAYVARSPGMFYFSIVQHPGIEPYGGSDFVRRAWNTIRSSMLARFAESVGDILFGPFRSLE